MLLRRKVILFALIACLVLFLVEAAPSPAKAKAKAKAKSRKPAKKVKAPVTKIAPLAVAAPIAPKVTPIAVAAPSIVNKVTSILAAPLSPSSSAQPIPTSSSSAPPATQTNVQSRDKIRGVNLGGWFIVEPWMSPSLISQASKQTGASESSLKDQWTLIEAFSTPAQARLFLEQHWQSWIVESDFAQIKSVGLNTVRIPVPHWAFNTNMTAEPYIPFAEQPYIGQALRWASKYNLDVILDMHTAPNSQNGYESSGRLGSANFRSTDGPTNAARLNAALQTLVQLYVNDGQYNGVVKYIEVLNEPTCYSLGQDYMTYIFQSAIANITQAISANAITKPQVILHDCFVDPLSDWQPAVAPGGGLAGTAFMLDTHRYHVFSPRDHKTKQQHFDICHNDGDEIAKATTTLGKQILTGEFSLAISCLDCETGLTADAAQIALVNRQFFETQTTAYERGAGWIFWNWKTEGNTPWSFKDALTMNWIPADPTEKSLAQ